MALSIWEFTGEAFARCIGQIFEFYPPESGEAIRFELVKAVSFGRPSAPILGFPQRPDCFSLLFRSADGRALDMGLHRMVHPEFEAAGLYAERMQPPPDDPQGVYYAVIFS